VIHVITFLTKSYEFLKI